MSVMESLLIEMQKQIIKWGCMTIICVVLLFSIAQVYIAYRIEVSLSHLQTTTEAVVNLLNSTGLEITHQRNVRIDQSTNIGNNKVGDTTIR